ncbi:MAG: molybdopterin-dependent oxidoreductase [Chloroflexi bacterium]|nr:molybdopterin-dependent oxidoreductase [Chloroflexota bacterium]
MSSIRLGRRTLLKAAGASGGAVAAAGLAGDPLATLVRAEVPAAVPTDELVPTLCWIGKQDCGILARKVNGRVVSLWGNPAHPRNNGTLCPKGVGQITALYDPHRLRSPLVRTNAKGVAGEWRPAGWDEALGMIAARITDVRARDKRLLIWQKGRSKAEAIYDTAFVNAIGATKIGHGAYCSDAGYRAAEYTLGPQGVLHPDFRNTRYVLAWGWNVTNAGGNKLCWITWPQQLAAARERGLRVVAIDPRLRGAGSFADEWVPIRPGTDLALALGFSHVLVKDGTIDKEYLTRYTNAPFLVKADGTFLRASGKEQVWDKARGAPAAFDAAADPMLEGQYVSGGEAVRPAYQAFADHLASYAPEAVATITGVPAEQIARIARELAANAEIGSTKLVDGLRLPYRPVSAMAYHMSQQELGFQALRAMIGVFMLLGAVEAVGGVRVDATYNVHGNFKALDEVKIKDPPYDPLLRASRYFPINSVSPSVLARTMLDPGRYGVDHVPEVLILHMANPLLAFGSQRLMKDGYAKFKFVAVIDPWLSETADLIADVVLPAATMEKYEGPVGATDFYTNATALRTPIMQPLFGSRGEVDIYLDLAEKAGVLFGAGGFLDELNKALGLKAPYVLDTSARPEVRDLFDRWAKSQGLAEGIAKFEKEGVWVRGAYPAKTYYGYAHTPPFDGIRHRLYGESLLRYQRDMRAKGADEAYWRDYTPLPTWRRPTMDGSPPDYDLTLISFKLIEFKQSRTSFFPLVGELAPRQRLEINPRTARAKGIADGDDVWVESHHALTGQTQRVKVQARLVEGIRPDVVGMPHHYGTWTHPLAKGQGPAAAELFFGGEGYITNTADQSFQVKVRVTKA